MNILLKELKPIIEKNIDLQLLETYSYARLYKKVDVLIRHKDRYSCEISSTLNLGGDRWPIYIDPTGKTNQAGIKVELEPGDMLVYRGHDCEHWREPFEGQDCVQVFLHYNNADMTGAETNMYDTRPHLGLHSYFKGLKID